MAIAYINATRRRGKRQRGGGYTPKKGLFSVGVFSYQCTPSPGVALVIRATDSLFPLKLWYNGLNRIRAMWVLAAPTMTLNTHRGVISMRTSRKHTTSRIAGNTPHLPDEEWRDVPGYSGHYMVSSLGRVKSLKFKKHRILRPNNATYPVVLLCKDGKIRASQVHLLVAGAFLGDANGREVNHIDFNKRNNEVTNLEYTTRRENVLHAARAGKFARKLTEEQVLDILRMDSEGISLLDIAKSFNVTHDAINRVVTANTWAHLDAVQRHATARRKAKKDTRQAIVQLRRDGWLAKDIAEHLGISIHIVYKVIERPQKYGGVL